MVKSIILYVLQANFIDIKINFDFKRHLVKSDFKTEVDLCEAKIP